MSSFTSDALDVTAVAEVLRARGVWFVLNASQALGAQASQPALLGVDAVVGCGWKWLCGPYGTGYAWFAPPLADRLAPPLRYWRTEVGLDSLTRSGNGAEKGTCGREQGRSGLRRLDAFAAANFFNVLPWTAALETLEGLGRVVVARRASELAARLVAGLRDDSWVALGPETAGRASPIVVVAPRGDREDGVVETHERLAREGVHVSLRGGRLRFAPHVYNTDQDIDRTLEILNEAGR